MLLQEDNDETNTEIRDALVKSYGRNGKSDNEVNHKDSEQESMWKSYYSNGILAGEGNYKNGMPEGLWRHYHENGIVLLEHRYKNGKKEDSRKISYEETRRWQDYREISLKYGEGEGLISASIIDNQQHKNMFI